jgi:hypothetical protein
MTNRLRRVGGTTLRLARRAVIVPLNDTAERLFDRRMGVQTRGALHNDASLSSLSVGGDSKHYEPAHLLLWRRLHAAIPVDRGASSFVDLGAGRGRAVILAAEMGFCRVVGVELDEHLARSADSNVRLWRARRGGRAPAEQSVSIVHGDAATYRLPDGPVVLWLYNPFGPVTLRHVLQGVCERTGDETYVAYFNPVHKAVFDEFPQLTVHAASKRWVVYRLAQPARPSSR